MECPLSEDRTLKTKRFSYFQILALLACAIWAMANCFEACAATAHLNWDALDDPSVVAYDVRYGGASGHYTNGVYVGTGTSVTVSNLTEGVTYYFVVTSFDGNGFESPYSDEVSWHVPLAVTNPYPAVQGTYGGLFAESDQPQVSSSGAFSVTVGPRGAFSGRVQMITNRLAFSGRLNAQCQATALVSRTGRPPLTLNFNLGTGDSTGEISGTVSDGNWTAVLSGERAVFNATNNPAPFAGNYTMVFPGVDGDPSLPAGNGFGAAYVYRSGVVAISGTLGDGAKFLQSTTVSTSKLWPLYTPLYNGNGSLSGWAALPSSTRPAELTWIRQRNHAARFYPAGFTNRFTVDISPYVSPSGTTGKLLNFANPSISFAGGNLSADFTNSLRIGPFGGNLNLSSNYLTLTFSLVNGTFRGTVVDPSSRSALPFSGVVLQNLNLGAGLLLGNNLSSGVTLSP